MLGKNIKKRLLILGQKPSEKISYVQMFDLVS